MNPLIKRGNEMVSKEDFGSKQAQVKMSKPATSRAFRNLRVMQGQDINPAFCNECGFRVRSENHLEGEHHKGTITRPRKRH